MDFNNNQRFKTAILSELQLADSLKTGAQNDYKQFQQSVPSIKDFWVLCIIFTFN